MKQSTTTIILILGALVAQVYTAPQFVTFKNGKVGVNFGGYHAAAAFDASATGKGLGGGLVAEAGTPFGQYASSGLSGAAVNGEGVGGNLYAGATAGGNLNAAAGLTGAVSPQETAGAGTALGGGKSVHWEKTKEIGGSSGFSLSGGSSYAIDKNIHPIVKTVEVQQPVYKTVKTEIKTETANEVIPSSTGAHAGIETRFNVDTQPQPAVLVKEVSSYWGPRKQRLKYHFKSSFHDLMSSFFSPPTWRLGFNWESPEYNKDIQIHVERPPPTVFHKEIVRYKPHRRHHLHKTAYIGGYIGSGGEVAPPSSPPAHSVVYESYQPAVYKTYEVQPAIHKRVDVGVNAGAEGHVEAGAGGAGSVEHTYTKRINFQRNPSFFADIFNIPISTLNAVGNFLGNAAASTNVSVQKSASVHTDTDSVASKHLPSSSTSSETHVSVQTPPASSFLGDIFAIPINTLGAVSKFLENNVPARKNVQISSSADGEAAVTKVRRGPHARRRANKEVVIVEDSDKPTS